MAKFKSTKSLTQELDITLGFTEKQVFEALEAGIEPVVDSIKSKGKAMGVYDTGQTLDSLKPGKPKRTKDGDYKISGTFHGNRRAKKGNKKVRNSEVAFINEFGVAMDSQRPFVSEGNAAAADRAAEIIANKLYGDKK